MASELLRGSAFLAGCSNSLPIADSSAATAKAQLDPGCRAPRIAQRDTAEATDGSVRPMATSAVMPSPGRTNPFELPSEFEEPSPTEVSGGKRDIRVAGFVEVNEPVVMLQIDGKTHSFKAGETHLRITVNEIAPPRVRLTYDNVTWNASLFDSNRSSSRDTLP